MTETGSIVAAQRSSLARLTHLAALALSFAGATAAHAVDLFVGSVQVNQGVQFGGTLLAGNNTTILRVSVATGGVAVAGVDAILRMSVNNVPVGGPPIFSLNGPITAPASVVLDNVNHTLNFMVIPPVSNDVDYTIELNPNFDVVETNYTNNSFTVANGIYICRKVVELPYVPINYTLGGGLPPPNLMEPGIGDGFIRAIYSTEWNYHKSPLPPLNWAANINSSTGALHNTLNDIRINQLPASGQSLAPFIFAYLPGNPFSGNGQANGIPGTSAFGNTDQSRSQRTTAHELGHCFGLQHNNLTTGVVGFDEEHHLLNTQGLPQTHAASQWDIMVAGLLTHEAWIANSSYSAVLGSGHMNCPAEDEGGVPNVPVMRISGVITHDTRAVSLDPVTRVRRGTISSNTPNGDIRIDALNAAGQVIWSIGFRTDTARELCEHDANGEPMYSATGPFHVLAPESVAGEFINEVRIIDTTTGNLLASRVRSANQPQAQFVAIEPGINNAMNDGNPVVRAAAAKAGVARLAGRVRVSWNASDPDGDALSHTLLYTPDAGERWYPLVVNTSDSSFEYDSADVPGSVGNNGRFMLVTTDGLNVRETMSEGGIASPGTPPETFLLTPNNGNVFPQLAPIAFHGTSWDKEDQLLNGSSMRWFSNIDGEIATGRLFIKSNLSVGTHNITLIGTDSSLQSNSKVITITITPRQVIHPDCNGNFIPDWMDILNGAPDVNGNGIPDECEVLVCPPDVNGDNVVNVDDMLIVISTWGDCPAPPAACPANIINTGTSLNRVDVDDLLAVISGWGACP